MESSKTDQKETSQADTLPAGARQGRSAQTASLLTDKNREELLTFAKSNLNIYRHHVNRDIFDEVQDAILNLYGAIVMKDGNDVLVFYRHEVQPDRQTSMLQVNLVGALKQECHISVFSDYGADMVELQDKISTVNDEMINDFAHSLQTTPIIEVNLRDFILKILDLLPDYIPYHYTTIDNYFSIDERLVFNNPMTSHTVMVSIAPFRMCWKNVNQEAFDNHTSQTVMQ